MALDEEFIKEHELAFSFHLQKIRDSIEEFNMAYHTLREVDMEPSSDEFVNLIWDNVNRAATAVWQIAQTLNPTIKGKSSTPENQFKLKRGKQLLELLNMDMSDKKIINDFRNRLTHFDEDFDEWYFNSKTRKPKAQRRIVWRGTSDGKSPVHNDENAVVQWYDYKWGVFHSFGKQYDLRAYNRGVELVSKCVSVADEKLAKLCPNRMEISFGKDPT